jgi:hypothetical protein
MRVPTGRDCTYSVFVAAKICNAYRTLKNFLLLYTLKIITYSVFAVAV